jgi:nicotinamide-nucleotide adenylyltransferase
MDIFQAAVVRFQSSEDEFEVVCTLPARSGASSRPEPRIVAPAGPVRQLVVLDSSFNPPTKAHLQMALDGIRSAAGSLNQFVCPPPE